jgi:hypothetical protein
MSIVETALVFVGIPALIIMFFALLVYGRSQVKGPNRYRPGKPWNFGPVWYLPHPTPGADANRLALESSSDASKQQIAQRRAVGGASGEW